MTERWVRAPDDIDALALRAQTPRGEKLLATLLRTLSSGLEAGDYALAFGARPRKMADIVDGRKLPLLALRRIDKNEPTCTTVVSIDDGNEDGGSGGEGIGTATRGICGGIAIMHSALAIGLVRRDEVVNGTHFAEDPLARVQGADRDQMTFERLRAVHETLGATVCQIRGAGDGFATANRGGLTQFNTDLDRFVNDPDHDWDCTIFFRAKRGREWVLGHFEHVQSVSTAGGTTTITTTNGLDQGNQTDAVPVSPGSNTWTSTPGATPPFTLSGSTHADAAIYQASLPPVQNLKLLCCRRP